MTSDLVSDPSLVAGLDQFFDDKVTPGVLSDVEVSQTMPTALWTATEELGLAGVGVDEDRGGSGGTLFDATAVMMAAGRHAVPLPLVETHCSAWMLAAAGLDVPPGPLSLIVGGPSDDLHLDNGRLVGTAPRVMWARSAAALVAAVGSPTGAWRVAVVDPTDCRMMHGTDLSGLPCDDVEIAGATVVQDAVLPGGDDPRWRMALLRAAQMAGALESVNRLTQRYCSEREQFGRPIGRFQAVQEHLVLVAEAAELTAMSVWRATLAASERPASFEAAAAKLVANENARTASRAAHQAHGAIGMTREYPLHQFTRRLHAWRHDLGTERQLAASLASAVRRARSFARTISDHDNGLEISWPTT